ncbi:MAG: hypothetical protein ACP5OA_01820 [Candidatus Woesearchaeota archaeon]
MQNTTRGQAAVEFLVTYGWAILAAMITIGVLSYFGIFNTGRYVNDACTFGDQMMCDDFAAYQNGTVKVRLRNNLGVDIDINATMIKSIYGEVNCSVAGLNNIAIGTLFEIQCDITDKTVPINDKLKYRAIITFNRHGSNNLHNQTGDVTATVQKV